MRLRGDQRERSRDGEVQRVRLFGADQRRPLRSEQSEEVLEVVRRELDHSRAGRRADHLEPGRLGLRGDEEPTGFRCLCLGQGESGAVCQRRGVAGRPADRCDPLRDSERDQKTGSGGTHRNDVNTLAQIRRRRGVCLGA